MTLQRATALALLTALLLSTLSSVASAYEGTSLFDNIAPPSQSHGHSEDHPLSSYGLDTHISAGVETFDTPVLPDVVPKGLPDFNGIPASVLSGFTDALFTIHRWAAALALMLFDFAWSFDLIDLALNPVREATGSLYQLLGGDAFLIVVVCVAVWACVRTFRGAIASTVAQLGVSAICIVVCLFLISQGGRVADGVSKTVNGLSPALLAAVTGGGGRGDQTTAQAHESAKDGLHDLMIKRPWMILQFGGLSHCLDKHGKPVNPFNPTCRTKVPHEPYAKLYLKAGEPNGKGRTLVYNAIKEGRNPTADQMDEADVPQDLFAGVTLSDKDKAGVDLQQQPAAYERFGATVLVLIGGLGLDVLIGGLSASVLVAQAVFLLLLMLAVVVLLAAPIPRFGHTIFHEYLGKLFFTGTRKLWNTLILALAVAILSAIQATAPTIGVLASTGLGCLFAWALVFARDDLYDKVQQALSGRNHHEQRRMGEHARDAVYIGRATRPFANVALAGVGAGVAGTVGTAKVTRAGARRAGVMANDYAAKDHAKQLAAAATEQARGRAALEAQRQASARRLREERARRARISELQKKQQCAANSTTTTTSGNPPGAFTASDRKELAGLQAAAMQPEAYKRLRTEVAATDRRARQTGDPFTADQVATAAKHAGVCGTREREAPEKTAEKARNWRATHDRVFGGGVRNANEGGPTRHARDTDGRVDRTAVGGKPRRTSTPTSSTDRPKPPPPSGPKPGSKPPPPKGK